MQNYKKWTAIIGLLCAGHVGAVASSFETGEFNDLLHNPVAIIAVTETGTYNLEPTSNSRWQANGVEVTTGSHDNALTIELTAPQTAVKSLEIHWKDNLSVSCKYLGDAWERAYGDLEWKTLDAKRIMPWYFLAYDDKLTYGYGVKVDPAALCYWTVDETNIILHADVRCGGMGVELGKRTLKVCTVVCRQGKMDETPFAAAREFCELMCPEPRLPKKPVYGFNDWYCTYGHDTADKFLTNVAYVVSLVPKGDNRPFAVVDDGWQWKGTNGESPGLWNQVKPDFSKTLTMAEFAKNIRTLGARPGLWYRPLLANADQPQSWRLQRDSSILDPTVPEVRALIKQTMARFHDWGYDLIKHDYSTFDICGRWGMKMGGEATKDGWAFADRSKTTAEVIRNLYEDIRDGAGKDTMILGCNTIGHLSAGLFEMQRIGDDTSGNDWGRTLKMGVNCLAFRLPQNGTFFAVDSDCAGQVSSNSVPWVKNSQWLYLLAHSGSPLFVSFPRDTVSPEQEAALREALAAASRPQPLAEPLDWLDRRTPAHWKLDEKEVSFSW
jgi:alpha-galactosidase